MFDRVDPAERPGEHTRAGDLAIERVPGDMGRGDRRGRDQLRRNIGLPLPDIEHGGIAGARAQPPEQCIGIDHIAP